MSAYGSIVYQMRDANMDSSNTCEFVYKALKVISKTVVMTVFLVLAMAVPVLMVIMGVQYLHDCPLEPNIPIYLLVGGCFGTLKLLWILCQQVRSRRYERIDDAFAEDSLDEIFTSTSYRATDVALTIFLLVWFGMGNYWVYRIYLPNFQVALFKPNNWCSKTLYLFAVAQLLFVYSILGFIFLLSFCLACGQKCVMLFGESYK
nr:transmembrane protein 272-like [Procambarus clarkii]